MSGGTPLGQDRRRRLCIDDERKVVVKALAAAEVEKKVLSKAVERGRKRLKRAKQKRLKLQAMGKLDCERLRNFVDAKIVELEREQKAAKVKMRAAWAQYDARREDLDEFEQFLLDDGTHDDAGFQVLSAAEVEGTYPYYWRAELGLEGVQLFA